MTDKVTTFPREPRGEVVSFHEQTQVPEDTVNVMIDHLESVIARVRAGEVTGFAIVHLHRDNLASYSLMGAVGGYSVLGAVDMVHHELTEIHGSD